MDWPPHSDGSACTLMWSEAGPILVELHSQNGYVIYKHSGNGIKMDGLTNIAAGLVPRPSSAFVASKAWERATAFVD